MEYEREKRWEEKEANFSSQESRVKYVWIFNAIWGRKNFECIFWCWGFPNRKCKAQRTNSGGRNYLGLGLGSAIRWPNYFCAYILRIFYVPPLFCFSLLAILWPQSQTETAFRAILMSFKMYSQIKIPNNSEAIHILINIKRGLKRGWVGKWETIECGSSYSKLNMWHDPLKV